MGEITALFSDVGGVVLTNGWDRSSRRRAVEKFGLEWEEFEDRHELVAAAFDKGELGVEQYLDRTVFYRPREFSKQEFKEFMLAQSTAYPDTLVLLDRIARSRKYLLATLNNESRELNQYRIDHFGLRSYFAIFFSSCFLGVKKPDETIYRLALQMTQRAPQECVFVDDRALNLDGARALGMHAILFQGAAKLERELVALGMEIS